MGQLTGNKSQLQDSLGTAGAFGFVSVIFKESTLRELESQYGKRTKSQEDKQEMSGHHRGPLYTLKTGRLRISCE